MSDFPIDPDVVDGVDLADILNRLDSDRLSPVESTVKQLVETDADYKNRISGLEVMQQATTTIVNQHTTEITDHDARIELLESHEGEIPSNVESRIKDLEDSQITQDTQISYNTVNIAGHEELITNHEASLANHETRIGDNSANITNHEASLADHETRIADNYANITNHETRLGTIETLTNQGGLIFLWNDTNGNVPANFLLCDGVYAPYLPNPLSGTRYIQFSTGSPAPTIEHTFDYIQSGRFRVTLTASPIGLGTFYMGDDVPEVPEVPPELDGDGNVINEGSPAIPAIPEGELTFKSDPVEYTYREAGDYTVRFVPNYGTGAEGTVQAVETTYTISVSIDEMTVNLALDHTVSGTYYLGNGKDEIPEIPPDLGEDGNPINEGTPAVPAVPKDTIATDDGTASFTYAEAGSYNIRFTADDGNPTNAVDVSVPNPYSISATVEGMTVNLSLSVAVGGTYYFGNGKDEIPEIPPDLDGDGNPINEGTPAVPAVPEGELRSEDGSGSYDYPEAGNFTIRYSPDNGHPVNNVDVGVGVKQMEKKWKSKENS